MKAVTLILLFLTGVIPANGQQSNTPQPPKGTGQISDSGNSNNGGGPTASGMPSSSPTQFELNTSDKRLNDALANWLDKHSDVKPAVQETAWDKAWPVLLGTFVGGMITLLVGLIANRASTQQAKLHEEETTRRETELAKLRATIEKEHLNQTNELERNLEETRTALKMSADVLQGRKERLEKFHAPLRSLFQQSRGLTDVLCNHVYRLSRDGKWPTKENPDTREYAFLTNDEARALKREKIHPQPEDEQSHDRRLRVWHGEKWVTFRVLDFMPWLIEHPDCKPLLEQIVAIGRKKTIIISTLGGLATIDQKPTSIFGEYLAHFAVLESVFKSKSGNPQEPGTQKAGYYPRDIDSTVESGFKEAQAKVSELESLAAKAIERFVTNVSKST